MERVIFLNKFQNQKVLITLKDVFKKYSNIIFKITTKRCIPCDKLNNVFNILIDENYKILEDKDLYIINVIVDPKNENLMVQQFNQDIVNFFSILKFPTLFFIKNDINFNESDLNVINIKKIIKSSYNHVGFLNFYDLSKYVNKYY